MNSAFKTCHIFQIKNNNTLKIFVAALGLGQCGIHLNTTLTTYFINCFDKCMFNLHMKKSSKLSFSSFFVRKTFNYFLQSNLQGTVFSINIVFKELKQSCAPIVSLENFALLS